MAEVTMENVEAVFKATAPRADVNPEHIKHMENKFVDLAKEILSTVPRCADRSAVIRDLRLCKMMCIDSIAKGGII